MERTFSFNRFLCLDCFLHRSFWGFNLVNNLTLNRVEYLLELTNLLFRNIKAFQSLLKIFPSGIELKMSDRMLAVSSFHITSLIKIGPTSNKANKRNLSGPLFVHISVGKVVGNPFVLKHDFIELMNNSGDGFGLAESFVEGHYSMLVKVLKSLL